MCKSLFDYAKPVKPLEKEKPRKPIMVKKVDRMEVVVIQKRES